MALLEQPLGLIGGCLASDRIKVLAFSTQVTQGGFQRAAIRLIRQFSNCPPSD